MKRVVTMLFCILIVIANQSTVNSESGVMQLGGIVSTILMIALGLITHLSTPEDK